MAKELENKNILCEQCGNGYEQVGVHWAGPKDCSYPSLSENKKEILIGLLMGDGTIHKKSKKNQYIATMMISPNYLQYVDNELGWLSTGVSFHRSAKENAETNRKSGFSSNAKEKNYSDIYRHRTRTHPFITSLTDWYSSGKKVWPEDIELTPTVLKHWYCGDGHHDNKKSNRIIISMSNEVENTEKVSNYFQNVGLPKPNNYNIGNGFCNACWTVEGSHKLWNYIGNPLPDFEYKWPEGYR
jgi:hypothetical protein